MLFFYNSVMGISAPHFYAVERFLDGAERVLLVLVYFELYNL